MNSSTTATSLPTSSASASARSVDWVVSAKIAGIPSAVMSRGELLELGESTVSALVVSDGTTAPTTSKS